MLGGSIGFILASVIAAGRVAELSRENKNLKKKLERFEEGLEVAIEQGYVDPTPSHRKPVSRQVVLKR
jgi:hypothetical protein